MTARSELAAAHAPVAATRASATAFWALCQRDGWNLIRHELAAFLAQSLLQPLFYLFIFGRVLPEIGSGRGGYGTTLLPGVVALTLFVTALQNVALPLVIEFSFTKEIEDRLLAPLPGWLVAVQKVIFAGFRGIVAAVLVIPLAELILPGGAHLGAITWPAMVALFICGAVLGASVGLVLGTAVPAHRINVVFATVLTPLLFTGATFYPWQGLHSLRWFQVVSLCNPLTYVSEGLRGAMTAMPHLGTGWIVLGIAVSTLVFLGLGLRGFMGRAVD